MISTASKAIRGSVGLLTISVGAAAALGGETFDLSWFTTDGGGETFSTGGDFELGGTIGQPDAGELTGAGFEMTGGFWFRVVQGDCNADGGVNLFDFSESVECLTGPISGPIDPACACVDFDNDQDIDLRDFGFFQQAINGF